MKRRVSRKVGAAQQEGGTPNRWPSRLLLLLVVVVVFGIAGVIGAFVRHQDATQLKVPTAGAGPSGLAIPVSGSPSVTLTVYEDMRDHSSRAFQKTYGDTLSRLVAAGLVRLRYREVAVVDGQLGGSGSLHAGNALACAQDAKLFQAYRKELLSDQPESSRDAFASNAHLIKLAKHVHGLDTDVFRSCVNDGTYDVWVKDSTAAFKADQGGAALPLVTMGVSSAGTASANASPSPSASATDAPETVVIAGQDSSVTPQQLMRKVLAAAVGTDVVPASPSASASPSHHKSKHGTASPSASASASS